MHLAAIAKTEHAVTLSRAATPRAREVWAAHTVDGVWEIRRQDEPGTPWLVRRIADGAEGGTHGTLRAARAAIAAGHADIAARVDAAGRRAASAARVAGASWDEVERARDAAETMVWAEIRAERAAA